jgi:Flp pilus assembly pilin Flp
MIQLFNTLHVLGIKFGESVRRRANGDSGQTAAEYMGIIVVIAIIIAAIATSGIGTTLAGNIMTKIGEIFGHA